ncbi:hypothetical protein CHS0354_007683 [Potamilus streckersoni]|uniref:Uncharacterized protein n=1 Tax=Potamilus streckersoni TaxID=2493646 RepID=A0AAE0VVP5_9BIVA|nr:hypothetical protein CHS0354_007683 [Potamilus streckersoni]
MGSNVDSKHSVVICTLVGDGMVGKTSLALTLLKKMLPEKYVATVFDNYNGSQWLAGDMHTVSMFDTAGQQDYEGLRVFTYKESVVIVVCYSVADRESFSSVRELWLPEIQKHTRGNNKTPIILVATQTDLRNKSEWDVDKTVSTSEGVQLAKYIGAEEFIECSVVNKEGVSEVLEKSIICASKQRKKKLSIFKKIFRKLV